MSKPSAAPPPALLPTLDRRILVRGTSFLRKLSKTGIVENIPRGSVVLVQDGDEPLAVILRFEDYELLSTITK